MSIDKRLFIGFFNYGIGQFLPKLINFLLIPVYAFYLAPSEFGVYDIFYTLFLFLLVLMRFNLPGAITRFYFDYQGKDDLNSYIKTIYLTVIGFSLAIAALVFIYDDEILVLLGTDANKTYLLIVLASAFLAGSGDIQKRLLQVKEQSAYSAKLNIATTIINIVLAILFVVIFDFGIGGLFYTMLISNIVFFIQAQFYLRGYLGSSVSFKLLPQSLKYSFGILPYLLIGHLNPVILKSILNNMFSSTSVGIFSMASRLTSPQLLIVSAFSSAVTPIYFSFLSKNDSTTLSGYKKSINRFMLLTFVVMIGFIAVMPPAIEMFLPSRYVNSSHLVSVISLGFMPQILYILISQDMFYSKKVMTVSLINIIGMLISFGVSYLLIPRYQELGLAIGQIVTPIFGMILTLIFTKGRSKREYLSSILIVIYMSILLVLFNLFTKDLNLFVRLSLATLLIPAFIYFHPNFRLEAVNIFKAIKLKLTN